MLILVVTSLDARPIDIDLRGKFGLLGGTIGAMEGNTITLPDAGGRVGALEANIMASARGYVIRNCSERALYVNDQAVGTGSEIPVGPGDEIAIGPYRLRALASEQAKPNVASAPAEASTPAATAMVAEMVGREAEVVRSIGTSTATEPAAGKTTAAAPIAATVPAGPSAEELERALLEGLGVADLELPDGLTPELMATLGAVLTRITQGTIDLLRIRAEAKSRVHAELTMIGGMREINPLKAAWDAQVALRHLLVPQRSDMLDPLRAMIDACDDLRLHDLGLVAGVHAAMASLLARFDPAVLEKKLGKESKFESFMPGGGKARRWDSLVELYGDLAVESDQDFWSIFERDFLQAYEAARSAARGDRF